MATFQAKLEATVRLFNDLPRPQTVLSSQPNHWIFTVRRVPTNPPSDLVLVDHSHSHCFLQAGPLQDVLSLTPAEKAKIVVPLLLVAYLKGHHDYDNKLMHGFSPGAPWTWSTDDPEFALAVEAQLEQFGVTSQLCRVGLVCKRVEMYMDEIWSELVGVVDATMGRDSQTENLGVAAGDTHCHGCHASSAAMKKCAACGKAYYCSRKCQKAHWKQHKLPCLSYRSIIKDPTAAMSAVTPDSDVFAHYARLSESIDLMAAVNLSLSSLTALRRLVVTGKDTPENLQLLFGRMWRESVGLVHAEERVRILMKAHPGCPGDITDAIREFDKSAPTWSPRPASKTEQSRVSNVRLLHGMVLEVAKGKTPTVMNILHVMILLRSSEGKWLTNCITDVMGRGN